MRKSLLLLPLVCGLGLGLYFALQRGHEQHPGEPAIEVQVMTLTPRDVARALESDGALQALHGAAGTTPMAVTFTLPGSDQATLQALIDDTQDPPVLAFAPTTAAQTAPLAEGRLTLIDTETTAHTGVIQLKAEFENPQQTLRPGQAVELQLQTGWMRQVLAVPVNVLHGDLAHSFVYRLEGDRAAQVAVTVLYRTRQLAVLEGVKEGDIVITAGPTALQAGSSVRVLAQ